MNLLNLNNCNYKNLNNTKNFNHLFNTSVSKRHSFTSNSNSRNYSKTFCNRSRRTKITERKITNFDQCLTNFI